MEHPFYPFWNKFRLFIVAFFTIRSQVHPFFGIRWISRSIGSRETAANSYGRWLPPRLGILKSSLFIFVMNDDTIFEDWGTREAYWTPAILVFRVDAGSSGGSSIGDSENYWGFFAVEYSNSFFLNFLSDPQKINVFNLLILASFDLDSNVPEKVHLRPSNLSRESC